MRLGTKQRENERTFRKSGRAASSTVSASKAETATRACQQESISDENGDGNRTTHWTELF